MGTVAENKNIKRNKILDSAYQLFMANSVTATAIDDVVKMAGVAKGTFYLYFKDKYDLLEQIITHKSADLLKEAVAYVKDNESCVTLKDKTLALSNYIIDFLMCHREFTALLNKNLSYCFNFFSSGINQEFNDMLTEFIDAFTKSGYSETEAKMTIYLITEMLGSVCCDSILGVGPYGMDEIKDKLLYSIGKVLEVKEND